MPISGVVMRESSVQLGQVGHPSPEAVNRTNPPVPTMPIWAMRFNHVTTTTALDVTEDGKATTGILTA
jgi:hypothetical protein